MRKLLYYKLVIKAKLIIKEIGSIYDLYIMIIYFANVGSTPYTGNKEKRIN